jgi:hypothetical protein
MSLGLKHDFETTLLFQVVLRGRPDGSHDISGCMLSRYDTEALRCRYPPQLLLSLLMTVSHLAIPDRLIGAVATLSPMYGFSMYWICTRSSSLYPPKQLLPLCHSQQPGTLLTELAHKNSVGGQRLWPSEHNGGAVHDYATFPAANVNGTVRSRDAAGTPSLSLVRLRRSNDPVPPRTIRRLCLSRHQFIASSLPYLDLPPV